MTAAKVSDEQPEKYKYDVTTEYVVIDNNSTPL